MKILVTGSDGQLGSELKNKSYNFNFEWIFTDINEFDLTNLPKIHNKLNSFMPKIIINCAAFTNVDQAELNSSRADIINNLAVDLISKWTLKNKCKLIHISTDYVFDGSSNNKLSENSITNPINVYGKTKLDGEKKCFKNDPNSIIIRTSWIFSVYGDNFVKSILNLLKKKSELNVVNDQFGSPTHASDLADAILKVIVFKKWIPGLYNFSNEGSVSWYQLANEIKKISGLKSKINPVSSNEFKTLAKRPKFSVLDKSKIKKTFNLSIPDFNKSLEKCILMLKHEK